MHVAAARPMHLPTHFLPRASACARLHARPCGCNPPSLPPCYPALPCSTKASCPGQLYVSREPYAWIDLSAGPSDYGPLTTDDIFHPPAPMVTVTGTEAHGFLPGGSDPNASNFGISGTVGFAAGGQVFTNTLPSLEAYGGAHAGDAAHRLLLPDLSALAASAVQQLAWPPVAHSKLAQVCGRGCVRPWACSMHCFWAVRACVEIRSDRSVWAHICK